MKWRDVLLAGILFALICAAILVPAYIQGRVDRAQRSITCVSAEANINQLQALASISMRLGIPVDFTIPTLPPECADS